MDEELSLGEEGEEVPGTEPRARRRRSARDPQQARRLVYLMLIYGVALILGSIAYGYLTLPSSTPPADVACALGELPPSSNSAQLALAATPAIFPPPENGSSGPQQFTLWVNATQQMLPGTTVHFAVLPIPGIPGGSACRLPIPASRWVASPASESLQPSTFQTVDFVGTPVGAYDRDGLFAVQVWVNTTGSPGGTTLGAIHTELSVD